MVENLLVVENLKTTLLKDCMTILPLLMLCRAVMKTSTEQVMLLMARIDFLILQAFNMHKMVTVMTVN